jgi:hypothetical protein
VEAIVKVIVNEVIVIMTAPVVAMPSRTATIPVSTAMPRPTCNAWAAHRASKTTTTNTKVGSTTEVASTHASSEVASACKASTTETVGGVRLLHGGRGEK